MRSVDPIACIRVGRLSTWERRQVTGWGRLLDSGRMLTIGIQYHCISFTCLRLVLSPTPRSHLMHFSFQQHRAEFATWMSQLPLPEPPRLRERGDTSCLIVLSKIFPCPSLFRLSMA